MRLILKLFIGIAILAVLGWFGYDPAKKYWQVRNRPQWETSAVIRGNAKKVITSTGKIEPVLKVSVGSFVSGPIRELHVDFNDEVTKGELLAKVDPLLYQASVDRDQAALATRDAEVIRVKAQLRLARSNLERGERLRQKNQKYLSDREMDALTAEFRALEASQKVAEATVKQAQAQLNNSLTNLGYCNITSPVDGVILERKIDPGQTLASQFQTPVLFVVAPDLRKKLHVFASVDESDIGLIRRAAEKELPVTFNVDAYPGELFEGKIEQVRLSATEVQSVITYPVVVSASNPDLKLLPSMTAQISFEVESLNDVLKIPNAALRYYPENVQYVRPQDRKLLDGSQWAGKGANNQDNSENAERPILSAAEKAESQLNDSRRHVWIVKDGMLEAIEVQVGFSDSRYTAVTVGEIQEGAQLVTGLKKKI